MDVFPDFDGLGGIGDLRAVIGALLTFVLIVAAYLLSGPAMWFRGRRAAV